jgi:hypothetical protein
MSLKEMRALSITQPWIECMLTEGKNVENRTWNTKLRGYIALHASGSFSHERFDRCMEDYGVDLMAKELDYGAIVGFARLIDVVTEEDLTADTEGWFEGPYGFVFSDIIKLKAPVETKGTLSFWKLKGKALEKSFTQLSLEQQKKLLKHRAE